MSEEKKAIPAKFEKIVGEVEKMSVMDLHELVKTLEEVFGVSAAAVAAAPAAGAGAPVAEEKTSFKVELTDGGAQKIAVIKVIKEALGLGLAEAKGLVDKAPAILKEDMKKEDAEKLKKDVEAEGGKLNLN